jgi:GPH family glycoside/pentoside/hexuronide:cation symporter
MGLLFGLVSSTSYLVMAMSIKEPKRIQLSQTQTSFGDEYRSAFGIYGFPQIFGLFIVVTMGLMVVNAILPFFLESVLRLVASQQSLVLGTLFVVAILVFPFWSLLASRFGKRTALNTGLSLLGISLLLLVLFSPQGISTYLISMTVLAGMGLSAVMLFPWAMLPDVVEFDALQTGRRREGLVYALFTFGQKIAGSLGVFSVAIMTSVFGYQQGIAEQAPQTLQAIKLLAGPMAAGVFFGAMLLVWRFPITKAQHDAAREKLGITGN